MAARLFLLHLGEGGSAKLTPQDASDSQRSLGLTEKPRVEWQRRDGSREPDMPCRTSAGREEADRRTWDCKDRRR